ncbi:hypothetical protein DEMA109039_12375 [Deinococcus marmoris]
MKAHWGEGVAALKSADETTGQCTLRLRTRLLVPTAFLFYVGPWTLDGQDQEGIVHMNIRAGRAIKSLDGPDLIDIHCALDGPPTYFDSFEQYGT